MPDTTKPTKTVPKTASRATESPAAFGRRLARANRAVGSGGMTRGDVQGAIEARYGFDTREDRAALAAFDAESLALHLATQKAPVADPSACVELLQEMLGAGFVPEEMEDRARVALGLPVEA